MRAWCSEGEAGGCRTVRVSGLGSEGTCETPWRLQRLSSLRHQSSSPCRRRIIVAASAPLPPSSARPRRGTPWSPRLVLTPLFWSGVRTRGLQGVASSSRRRRRVPFPSSPRRPSRIAVVVSRFATSACNASPHAAVTTAGRGGELGAAGRLCTWATWVGPANDGTAATDCWRRRSVHGSELDSPMPWAVHRVKDQDNAEKLQHNKQLTEHRQEEERSFESTEPPLSLKRDSPARAADGSHRSARGYMVKAHGSASASCAGNRAPGGCSESINGIGGSLDISRLPRFAVLAAADAVNAGGCSCRGRGPRTPQQTHGGCPRFGPCALQKSPASDRSEDRGEDRSEDRSENRSEDSWGGSSENRVRI